MRFCRERMRDSHFWNGGSAPIFRFQKRRGRHALLDPAPFPLRVRIPPSASDKQAPGPPPPTGRRFVYPPNTLRIRDPLGCQPAEERASLHSLLSLTNPNRASDHLEHQLGAAAHRPCPPSARRGETRCPVPAGDEDAGRAVSARGVRGGGIPAHAGARDEGI